MSDRAETPKPVKKYPSQRGESSASNPARKCGPASNPESTPTVDNPALPPIPDKRYFSIGEVSDLCGVKSHVLRYWEQEFAQLKPVKRRGNRRYYQQHDIRIVRDIRELLYGQGFTIQGARQQLSGKGRALAALGEGAASDSLASVRQELESIRAVLDD